jgi:hypothetical protein
MNIPDLYSARFKQILVHSRFTDVEINPPGQKDGSLAVF